MTGKSMGASFLKPEETYWLNIDKKPLPWKGWRKKYPPDNSKRNYKVLSDYTNVIKMIRNIHERAKNPLVVFILGHLEDYTSVYGNKRQRLRVIGKMANKHNIEGALIHNYYTHIDETKDPTDTDRYMLSTLNSGHNTARSPFGYWDTMFIPNNFQQIVDAVIGDWGEIG